MEQKKQTQLTRGHVKSLFFLFFISLALFLSSAVLFWVLEDWNGELKYTPFIGFALLFLILGVIAFVMALSYANWMRKVHRDSRREPDTPAPTKNKGKNENESQAPPV